MVFLPLELLETSNKLARGRLPIPADNSGRIFSREEQVLFGLATSLVIGTGAVVFFGGSVMVI
ncbi:hypothetical protein TIFTF001_001479 [Ficus carica]|uniref:Uncharacterized protein n=1 Tax=Ficus carica TaxID=3494 RepID=A0AA87ZGA2_FICCA|nr:hypothetical protein TIFTF001_001479 [Ficus carica]